MAPRILFLDAYDSFANNITALLATLLCADVHVLPIDAPGFSSGHDADDDGALRTLLAAYDAVVCGPGPGSPDCATDVGLMRRVWEARGADGAAVPVLGICLGFQSLVAAHGGRIRRLRSGGLHGMVRGVVARPDQGGDGTQQEQEGGIFTGIASPFCATLYHSLGADIGQDAIAAADWPTARWHLPEGCPDLVPLAWVDDEDDENSEKDNTPSERILMAVRHRSLPFWGLQYHPESVCTDAASHAVLANWFRAAMQWNATHGRMRTAKAPVGVARQATRPSLLSLQPAVLGEPGRRSSALHGTNGVNGTHGTAGTTEPNGINGPNGPNGTKRPYGTDKAHAYVHQLAASPSRLVSRTLHLPAHVDVPDLVALLQASAFQAGREDEPEMVVLDSASAAAAAAAGAAHNAGADSGYDDSIDDEAVRGRFSIIAVDVGAALRVEYRTGDRFATVRLPTPAKAKARTKTATVPLNGAQSIWQLLAELLEARRLRCLPPDDCSPAAPPFFGGFMGYVTYEQGLGDIGVALPQAPHGGRGHGRPDVCLAWVTRSVVVDHVLGVAHVQQLLGEQSAVGDDGWVDRTVAGLQMSALWAAGGRDVAPSQAPALHIARFQMPDLADYEDRVRGCQASIAAGDAYELCLTDEAQIHTVSLALSAADSQSSAWHLYRTLRTANPAPFASFVRLGGATLVSSSPERFLACRPQADADVVCSMRPMKGTVRRSAAVASLAQAEALLHVPKEEAENLMIVDLVRHDLHGVCGPGRVAVPRLLRVEPYGHVFQMVSTVEGGLGACGLPQEKTVFEPCSGSDKTVLDVLAASLPPGSMTGAPKKRSCMLLQDLEAETAQRRGRRERSLYSGVVGYLCASGRSADWSVTIRSLFRWDDETQITEDESKKERHDVWHIGAGGAVTILSTSDGERDEMLTKLGGPLKSFGL